MSITLELPPQTEAALKSEADRNGIPQEEVAAQLIQNGVKSKPLTAREVMALPPDKRRAYMEAAADAAAPLYEADLAKPPAERELTAFTILDSEPFLDYDE